MHEIALCRSVIDMAQERRATHGFEKVLAIRLELGALSHVEAEAFVFAFDVAARGTVAEGARLEVTRPPGQAFCRPCAATVALARRYDPCPQCGGRDLTIIGGEEMRVTELEVV